MSSKPIWERNRLEKMERCKNGIMGKYWRHEQDVKHGVYGFSPLFHHSSIPSFRHAGK
jgi:hypothetical protein